MVSKGAYHNYYGALAANPVPGPGVPNPTNGDLYYNTTTHTLMGYINGAWVAVAPVAAGVQESYAELYFYPGQCGDTVLTKTLTFSATCQQNEIAVTSLTNGQVKGAPYITTNTANGTMTIGASGAGKYFVAINASMYNQSANVRTYLQLRRNGGGAGGSPNVPNISAEFINPNASMNVNVHVSGIVNAAVNDVFDVVVCVATASNVTFYYFNFTMFRIGA